MGDDGDPGGDGDDHGRDGDDHGDHGRDVGHHGRDGDDHGGAGGDHGGAACGAPDGTAYHLRPRSGWLNDPNGMVFTGGRWHVFYQHNPEAARHDRIAWGHASSTDLLRWEHHPVAFGPTEGGPDAFGCWSGVVVPTADGAVALYTGVVDETQVSTVCLRHGDEDLVLWSAPQVVGAQPGAPVRVMRDPFVLQHGGRRWALLGAGLEDGTPAVLLYDCTDLDDWLYAGIWLRGEGVELAGALPADVWECPQLVLLGDGEAALILSLHDRGRLTRVVSVGGRILDDGGVPRFAPSGVDVLDAGQAFYAPQVAADPGPGAWLMGWVREEDRPAGGPDHAGCLTLPRRVVRDPDGGHEGAVRLVLDPLVAAGLPLGAVGTPAAGAGEVLDRAAQVEALADGARLVHPELGAVDLRAGTRVLVDADVVEVYPVAGPTITHRHPRPWSLVVPAGAAAPVVEVRPVEVSRLRPRSTPADRPDPVEPRR
ncbi:glycoside hydrolase family 32 protein [Ornithinimicrobium sp. W1679]|uniref:glycoside hydrolase family 32 protein n=1 Tax=Ornithinimicrobium sp. W1679 TaxID=3418770 RepID=UPI003CEBB48F